MVTDHINRDTLDNRRANLRNVSRSLNSYNRGLQRNCPNGYRGVYLHSKSKAGGGKRIYWEAQIGFDRKTIHLGLFGSSFDAALAVDAKARELFGSDAYQNFPIVDVILITTMMEAYLEMSRAS